MKPVTQTKFGAPQGNCFAACIASILEVPLDDVAVGGTVTWFDELSEWLRPRGLTFVWLDLQKMPQGKDAPYWWGDDLYWIASGPCDRTQNGKALPHSVVAKGRDLVHDPNPAGSYITKIDDAVLIVSMRPEAP